MVRPQKRFGQHWLQSRRVLGKILQAANLTLRDHILEIGPGTGVLTRPLLDQAGQVTSVEVDREAQEALATTLTHPNWNLILADFLKLDLAGLPDPKPNKVVANIPYNITGPILIKLLGTISQPQALPFECFVLLIQAEVASRILASPADKAYGALSLRVQYLAKPEKICHVPPTAFFPPPKVDSTVIRLTPQAPPLPCDCPPLLDKLIQLGFATRRKMLINTLKDWVDREVLLNAFQDLNIPAQTRAENLDLKTWIRLSNWLDQAGLESVSSDWLLLLGQGQFNRK